MTVDDRILIGEIRGQVADLRRSQEKLFAISDETNRKLDTLLGKIEEGWHTPTRCPVLGDLRDVRRDVESLKGWRWLVMGAASTMGFLLSTLKGWLLGK